MEIKSRFDHYNINVLDLQKSLDFYKKALGLKEVRRKDASDGSFTLVYIGDESTNFTLELTWLRDRDEPYDLGDNEQHLCVRVENDYDETRAFHKENGWVCYENEKMGLYFINDPDGYWIEILALDRK
ncbi:MAG TPA: VOC family protein [Dysgonamonadaceae bacterium]|nr:VOC family protein [Dysgonamonadaceae bacterium]